MSPKVTYPEIGLIALVPEKWSNLWQTRHHVLSRMAADFNVIWMTPPLGWRDCLTGDKNMVESGILPVDGIENLYIYHPPRTLPKLYRPPVLANLTAKLRLGQARNHLVSLGCIKIIAYLWRPEMADKLNLFAHDFSVYHIDDEYSFSASEQSIPPEEESLITRVDQLFIHSEEMLNKKGNINPATDIAPNGVDFALWSATSPEPEDLAEIPHPRIGYIGGIKSQLDFDLLLTISKKHPEMSFIFVGPMGVLGKTEELANELMSRPNVWHLGSKPAKKLPAYASHFDICTMCYQKNDYTRYIYPLKLHEYLATGKPVIGTSIPALVPFGDTISLADTAEEWSLALTASLSPESNSPSGVESRQKVARQYDWDLLVNKMTQTILRGLDSRASEKLDTLK